jgi:hypothetical protein
MALKNLKKKTTTKTSATKTPAPEVKKKKAPAPEPESKKGDWFVQGDEGFEKKEQIDQFNEMRRTRNVRRFYLKHKPATNPETGAKANEARIVFLDKAKPFFMWEHRVAPNGDWKNMQYMTCCKDHGPCPICETGDRPTYTAYLSVIDTRKWPKRKPDPKTGATITEPQRMLFPAKGVAMDKIKEIYEENKDSVRGLVVDVKRMGDKEPNCGREFTVKGRLSEEKLLEKFGAERILAPTKEYYKEKLALPTDDELRAVHIHVAVVAGSDKDLASDTDEYEEDDDAEVEEGSEDEDEVNSLLD